MKACCTDAAPNPKGRTGATGMDSGDTFSRTLRIAIAGNPNCGKTTLFNLFTGARQRTGNWPGVTVERKSGTFADDEGTLEIIDLPGVYTLRPIPGREDQSLDEKIARDAIVRDPFDVVVDVVDATNLERNLYLLAQLVETGRPVVIALNMMDEARRQGLAIDPAALEEATGVPVVPMVARQAEGFADLVRTIRTVAREGRRPERTVVYPEPVERLIAELEPVIAYTAQKEGVSPRWLAVRLIEGDDLALKLAGEETAGVLRRALPKLKKALGEDPDLVIADARYAFAHAAAQRAVHRRGELAASASDAIDRVVLHWLAGPAIFLFAIYLMFLLTINVGGAFVDFFDLFAQALFVDGTRQILSALGAPEWLIVVLADGLGAGIQTVATFIPIIGILFLVLSLLEDSGYMVRAAFLMDRLMRTIGLPGKAFVPLIVGFGCNVPAVLSARTLENPRERTLAILMTPFMSCGARLTVYALFAAVFFPKGGQNVVFLLYLVGIAAAILTGLLFKRTLLKGEATPFVMELPPYRLPRLSNLFLHAWNRLKGFVFGAGKVIVVIVAVLSFFNQMGTDGSFGHADTERSMLSATGKAITPVFAPLGIREENWPATVGLFTGVFAKEVVVGTLNALYATIDAGDRPQKEESPGIGEKISAAFASIPQNLKDLGEAFIDPLGLSATGDAEAVKADQGVDEATFAAMRSRFDGKIGAFAYMLFVLLYFPCAATFAAIAREAGLRWAVLSGAWSSWLGWSVAVAFYQAATLPRHPLSSAVWLIALAAIMAGIIALLHAISRQKPGTPSSLPAAAE